MKTIELQGAALDWAVAKCEGNDMRMGQHENPRAFTGFLARAEYYAESWGMGGPIIERERINLSTRPDPAGLYWVADLPHYRGDGPTPLIAAMRCYVASRLGDFVDVPEELTKC